MKMFEKVTIIGVGLIGGSLGLAIRSAGLSRQVTGLTRHKKTLNLAKRYKAITDATLELEKAVRDADLIIVAVPVFRIIKTVKNMMPYLKRGVIITDVGSVKGLVVKEIEKIPRIRKKEVYFIGGHPMAGSEKSGILSARRDLFKGSFCFLTRTVFTDRRALNKIQKFWEKIGATVKVVSSSKHDSIVAYISHLPHILAYHLSSLVPFEYYKYAGGSFLDMTRISSSNPRLWQDICSINSRQIKEALRASQVSMDRIRNIMANGNYEKLLNLFKQAKHKRDSYNKSQKSKIKT